MLAKELGTCSGSTLYFQAPSVLARQLLYYMTSCGYYYTDYDYRIERDDYGSYLLFYVCAGRLSVRSEDTTIVANAGQVGFLNCHLPHEYHTIGNTEFVWLHLDGANTAQLAAYITQCHGGFIFDCASADSIRKQLFDIIYTCQNNQLPSEHRLSEKLHALLMSFLDDSFDTEGRTAMSDDARIEAAIHFIEQNYELNISLEDAAKYVNMSKYHFSRLFKKACGHSPYEFLILTRLNRAKYLLKTTDLPIKVIAQNVGYQSVTTFTNAFTDHIGISPTRFRQYPI